MRRFAFVVRAGPAIVEACGDEAAAVAGYGTPRPGAGQSAKWLWTAHPNQGTVRCSKSVMIRAGAVYRDRPRFDCDVGGRSRMADVSGWEGA